MKMVPSHPHAHIDIFVCAFERARCFVDVPRRVVVLFPTHGEVASIRRLPIPSQTHPLEIDKAEKQFLLRYWQFLNVADQEAIVLQIEQHLAMLAEVLDVTL